MQGFKWRSQNFGAAEAVGRAFADLRLVAKYHSLDFYFSELSSLSAFSNGKPLKLPGLAVREVKSTEWRSLRFAEGLVPPDWIEKQFSLGSRLFVASEGQTVIGMNWISETFADLTHINRPRVTFPKGTVYSYRAMVSPAYRNQGIGSFLKRKLVEILKSEGHRLVFLAVFLKNILPHRWHQANGFIRWGRVTYIDLRVKDYWWTQLTEEGRKYPDLFYA